MYRHRLPSLLLTASAITALVVTSGFAAPPSGLSATGGTRANLEGAMERPLRYRPDGGDFVIENGTEFFNRPLYGGNTAFRVDGGDRPEFVLYLPGRGGNLRLAIATPAGTRWLHAASRITARYRPGELHYTIADPLLGPGAELRLSVLAYAETEGLALKLEGSGLPTGTALIWAYGGVNGQRGKRDGDIGTETVPISQWFQLQPDFAQGNQIDLDDQGFILTSPAGRIAGTVPAAARQHLADASDWNDLDRLLQKTAGEQGQMPARPLVVGQVPLGNKQPVHLSWQRLDRGGAQELSDYVAVTADRKGLDRSVKPVSLPPRFTPDAVPARYEAAVRHFQALRRQLVIDTPDPWINAAAGALNIAADAVWDEAEQAVMHGAIAWRAKLLGWRGAYALDALGWHERARAHLDYWAGRQNTDPIPAHIPPADADSNLARSEAGLHSNGDIANAHYDMNLVYIDALMRHLLWTGDLDMARRLWPTIERHLAWERRLFRRTFGPDGKPLYDAYAAIWASDDLQYHGGGVAYSSAYNYDHNRMAARLARLLGHDPAPYEAEAAAIAAGMRRHLWQPSLGAFAEFKDLLGHQMVHPSAGLWSFYHTMDAGLPSRQEAWRMADAVLTGHPSLPVTGPGVPDGDHRVFATTNWMPYVWSVNNVVMGENLHTALALWQAGRAEEAFALSRSAILASLYMGITPGNIGTLNYLDVYRRESQRDFADGSGVMARTLVEGLFGIRPDALAGLLRVEPGLPAEWDHASLKHPQIGLSFQRDGMVERWRLDQPGDRFHTVTLRLPAHRDRIAGVTANGSPVAWQPVVDAVGRPLVEITVASGKAVDLVITWDGQELEKPAPGADFVWHQQGQMGWFVPPAPVETNDPALPGFDWRAPRDHARFDTLDLSGQFNDKVTAIFQAGKYQSPRAPHVTLAIPSQGIGAWAGHVHAMADIDDSGLRKRAGTAGGRLAMPNGVPFRTPSQAAADNILFTSQWDNYPRTATLPLKGKAKVLYLLMAGSTNHMQSRIDNGAVLVTYKDGGTARLPLRNPDNWWPIEQDYFIDDYQFRRPGPLPPRIDLKTGVVRLLDEQAFKGRGGSVAGGAATALALELDPERELHSLTIHALANEVVVGLMAATLERP
ncbi:DUF4450 domain-containing protein [Niveispirillum irakense]|uniref:DUF4450 domain-containing protein n=1 Tax=Niveispirillum irakense TaxID=34011 RepID=UPI00040C65E5|nr:DUF4450 domain-containing protein [Niveispirillum irakense]